MICEKCHVPIESEVKFKCTDGNVPIGCRQKYVVTKKLCGVCAEIYKLSQYPNKIYMMNAVKN
jgi:hypothetical protein